MCGDSFAPEMPATGVRSAGRGASVSAHSRVFFGIAGTLLLFGLLYFAYVTHQKHAPNYAVTFIDRLTKKPDSVPLSNEALTINQLGYSYFKLDVPAKASSVALLGNFTASGRGGNTIEAFVFSETDYVNWQNNQQADPFYSSGKVTMGTIDANLPPGPGSYYLVFNNKFSVLAPKTIRLNAKLTYYH